MSAASVSSSNPVWKTFVAAARDPAAAGREKAVRAVAYPGAVALDRNVRPAEPRARLQQRDPCTGVGAFERGGKAREPAADDDDRAWVQGATTVRLRAATQPFSQP